MGSEMVRSVFKCEECQTTLEHFQKQTSCDYILRILKGGKQYYDCDGILWDHVPPFANKKNMAGIEKPW